MASSTKVGLLVAVLAGASGCVTGHLLDAARRWETPADVEAASLDGDRLALRYRATVTDDDGEPIGERRRSIAVPVAVLRTDGTTPTVEELPDDAALPGRPIPVARTTDAASVPALAVTPLGQGRPMRLDLRDGRTPGASLHTNALARSSTAGWVYPLLPLAAAVDVVGVPVLLFFAPAMLVTGE
jgi:hypothetical protein